jgi:hypothetical protein
MSKITWEDEGMAHRAALTTFDGGTAVLFVTRIRGSVGETATLTPRERRSLAAALLADLQPDEATAKQFAVTPTLEEEFLLVPRTYIPAIED